MITLRHRDVTNATDLLRDDEVIVTVYATPKAHRIAVALWYRATFDAPTQQRDAA